MSNKKKIDFMLVATLLTTIFYSSTYPYIHKEIVTVSTDSIIAAERIITCISMIIFSCAWNKKSDMLFRFYPLYCVLETFFGCLTTAYAIMTKNLIVYYLLDIMVTAIVTRNICCGGIKLRALRYKTEEEREHFDNNDNSMWSVGTIIGSIIAMFLNLNFNTMLCIATFGNAIDNTFYIYIYYQCKKEKQKL